MFPSEIYKELCIENQEVLREEWEKRPQVTPRQGDWYCDPGTVRVFMPRSRRHITSRDVWLPRIDQLIEMLEERGYSSQLYTLVLDQSEYKSKADVWSKKGDLIKAFGPDPATALLKAALEVVSRGGKEEK